MPTTLFPTKATPTGYADTFSVLLENAVIDPDLSAMMKKMAKFRNVVVHQYENVDTEIVIAILTKHLNDIERFREAILSYLNRPASAS